jgi:hypothetical protein
MCNCANEYVEEIERDAHFIENANDKANAEDRIGLVENYEEYALPALIGVAGSDIEAAF